MTLPPSDSSDALPGWQRRFFTIWTGQQFSLVGSSLAQFALVWWVTKLTGSATVLAMGLLISTLPSVFIGPFAGALVDRWPRRWVMAAADSLAAAGAAALALLFWSGTAQVWHVYLILFIRAVGQAFHWPAMTATTPLMVPSRHLARVSGLNQAIYGGVGIIAPPIGALLVDALPMAAIMLIDVVTAALAVVPLFFIAVPQPPRAAQEALSVPVLLADMREGWRYIWNWPGLRALVILGLLLNFLINPPMELLPILVTRHFGGEALRLGWLNSAWGVGAVIGGLLISAWGGFKRRIYTTLAGIAGLGVGVLMIGAAPSALFGLALAGMFVGAVMNSASNAALMALMQESIAPEMQGRVWATAGALSNAAVPLGMAIGGPLADATDVRVLYLGAGALYLLLGLGAFAVKSIREIEAPRAAQPVG